MELISLFVMCDCIRGGLMARGTRRPSIAARLVAAKLVALVLGFVVAYPTPRLLAQEWKANDGTLLANGTIQTADKDSVTIVLADGTTRQLPLDQLGRNELLRVCRFVMAEKKEAAKPRRPARPRRDTKKQASSFDALLDNAMKQEKKQVGDFSVVIDRAGVFERLRKTMHGQRATVDVRVDNIALNTPWRKVCVYGQWLVNQDKLQRLGFMNAPGAVFPLTLSNRAAQSLRRGDIITVEGRVGVFLGDVNRMQPRFGVIVHTVPFEDTPAHALVIETASQSVKENSFEFSDE